MMAAPYSTVPAWIYSIHSAKYPPHQPLLHGPASRFFQWSTSAHEMNTGSISHPPHRHSYTPRTKWRLMVSLLCDRNRRALRQGYPSLNGIEESVRVENLEGFLCALREPREVS